MYAAEISRWLDAWRLPSKDILPSGCRCSWARACCLLRAAVGTALWLGAAVAIPAGCTAICLRRGQWPGLPPSVVMAAAIGFTVGQLRPPGRPHWPRCQGMPPLHRWISFAPSSLCRSGRRIVMEAARSTTDRSLARWLRVRCARMTCRSRQRRHGKRSCAAAPTGATGVSGRLGPPT